jgi:hypothetical protein
LVFDHSTYHSFSVHLAGWLEHALRFGVVPLHTLTQHTKVGKGGKDCSQMLTSSQLLGELERKRERDGEGTEGERNRYCYIGTLFKMLCQYFHEAFEYRSTANIIVFMWICIVIIPLQIFSVNFVKTCVSWGIHTDSSASSSSCIRDRIFFLLTDAITM